MRIAMLGLRGVPATYGGPETHVEEIGSRLAARGHDVTVFCRSTHASERPASYRGMSLRYLPALATKHFDTISHTAISAVACVGGRFDVVHFHAVGPGLLTPIPRALSRAKVVLTVHGLDSVRAKWGGGASRVLRLGEWMSAHVPHLTIVVSKYLEHHYAERYGRRTWYIPNGVGPVDPVSAVEIVNRFDLAPGSYVLFVGRLVPEKAPDLLIRAFRHVATDARLVIAGGSSYTEEYVRSLRSEADGDERVVLTGHVTGRVLAELYSNAAAFVVPSSLEGLPLVLLEAAAHGRPVIVSDIPPNVEIVERDAPGHRIVPMGDEAALAEAIATTLDDFEAAHDGAERLRERVRSVYSWDSVVDRTEAAYRHVLGS